MRGDEHSRVPVAHAFKGPETRCTVALLPFSDKAETPSHDFSDSFSSDAMKFFKTPKPIQMLRTLNLPFEN